MAKKITILIVLLISIVNAQMDNVIIESCSNGYPSDCDVCGYYKDNIYENTSIDFLDAFINVNSKDYVVSTNSNNSYTTFSDINSNINIFYSLPSNIVGSNNKGLVSNYLPKDHYDDVALFVVQNFYRNRITNNNIGQRPLLGIVKYHIKYYPILNWENGNYTLKYNTFITNVNPDGTISFSLTPHFLYNKGFDIGNALYHTECYKIYGSYCGDGIVDPGEQCDNGSANFDSSSGGQPQVVNGVACDNTCHIIQPQCGPAATTYDYNQTNWVGDFCSNYGSLSGNAPNFPDPGQTVRWICSLGNYSVTCQAYRQSGGGGMPHQCKDLILGTGMNVRTKTDDGYNDNIVTINPGQKIYFKCESDGASAPNPRFQFYYNWINDYTKNFIDGHGTILTGSYIYSDPGTYVVWCRYNYENFGQVPACIGRVIVGEGGGGGGGGGGNGWGYCGDGIVQQPNSNGEYEECDDGSLNGTPNSNCDSNCHLKEVFVKWPIQCSFVDPPSIQLGEYLPFWWALDKDTLNNNPDFTNSCNSDSDVGNYNSNLSALKCKFKIINGSGYSKEFEIPCDTYISNSLRLDFKQDYKSHLTYSDPSIDNSDGNYMREIEGSDFGNILGEYQIQLEDIIATQKCVKECVSTDAAGNCTSWNYHWQGGYNKSFSQSVCLMNFSVTRPYLVQNGSLASTVNNDVLNDFYNLDGSKVVGPADTDLISSNNIINSYDWIKVKPIIQSFIDKYRKLAIQQINLSSPVVSSAKKVVNKNIVFINAGGNVVNINSNNLPSPLTLIIENSPEVIVNGSLQGAPIMLIVPNGKIYFKSLDCDKEQKLNGIFIAGSGFDTDRIINNNLNSSWCRDGRLVINGVLIGSGIDNLWKKRRSVLKDWFNVTHETKIEKIRKGGSLIVNTNTDIWKKLPPGADEILNQIRVYKK